MFSLDNSRCFLFRGVSVQSDWCYIFIYIADIPRLITFSGRGPPHMLILIGCVSVQLVLETSCERFSPHVSLYRVRCFYVQDKCKVDGGWAFPTDQLDPPSDIIVHLYALHNKVSKCMSVTNGSLRYEIYCSSYIS